MCPLSKQGRSSNAHFNLAIRQAKKVAPSAKPQNVISFSASSEGKKNRVVSMVGRARAHRCLDTRSATPDGAAMHPATRSRVLAYLPPGVHAQVLLILKVQNSDLVS